MNLLQLLVFLSGHLLYIGAKNRNNDDRNMRRAGVCMVLYGTGPAFSCLVSALYFLDLA